MNERVEHILTLMDVLESIRQDPDFAALTASEWVVALTLFIPNLLASEQPEMAEALHLLANWPSQDEGSAPQ